MTIPPDIEPDLDSLNPKKAESKAIQQKDKAKSKAKFRDWLKRNSMCLRKNRYKTKGDARLEIEIRTRWKPLLKLRTYECPFCGGWHLTSNEKK